MDRALLADFLRARREVLQPEDVGLPRGSRRRTGGLRREEVAALA
ncbi:transcriptional regulator, partial [Streptomyces sp. NPDC094472]